MLERMFFDIVEITIGASFVIAIVVWLFPFIDKNYTIHFRKVFWLLMGVRLLIPYNFSLPNAPIGILRLQGEFMSGGSAIPIALAVALLWGIGVFVSLRVSYLQYVHFKEEMLEDAEQMTEPEILSLVKEVAEELLLTQNTTLYYSKRIKTPTVIGVLNPKILLPMEEYQLEELRLILIHECIHIDNRDIFYKCIMSVVKAVHWFNPFVHKMVLLSFRDIELICDQEVVEDKTKEERVFYVKTILDSVKREKQRDVTYSTCFFGNETIMKQRIDAIFEEKKKKNGNVLLVGILLIYMAVSLCFSCGLKPEEEVLDAMRKEGGIVLCMNEEG